MNSLMNPVRDVSDTARWVAHFRALESRRPDALFHDPFAEQLTGERGFEIARNLVSGTSHDWAWAVRTRLFDQFLSQAIQRGADLVLNLAAGLDARPYRIDLNPALDWVEVDLPEIISYKQEILAQQTPRCRLQRFSMDLSNLSTRRALLADLGKRASRIVVLTEGLLIYFSPAEVSALATDLAAEPACHSWIIDLASPGQLKIMQRTMGVQLSSAGAAFKFGPLEGAQFFSPLGWKPSDVRGLLKTAAELNRAPAELLSLLPEPKSVGANYPWTGVCLLDRSTVE